KLGPNRTLAQYKEPLVTWQEDPEGARTCGRFHAQVVSRVNLQKVLDREVSRDGDAGYCLAKRVRHQVYYGASADLLCKSVGNQCTAGACMRAAAQVYAGDGTDGVPAETVRAMCKS
ncbi:unnamed protein product, partial [Ectocarpus sp. 6 AP-2014]